MCLPSGASRVHVVYSGYIKVFSLKTAAAAAGNRADKSSEREPRESTYGL